MPKSVNEKGKGRRKQERLDKSFQTVKKAAERVQQNNEYIADMVETKGRFYQYSLSNSILISEQQPQASYVQSYSSWERDGHPVQEGAQGISIVVPVKASYIQDADENLVPLRNAPQQLKEEYKNGNVEVKQKIEFRPGYIFDISQTDCSKADYSKFIGEQSQDHTRLCNALEAFSRDVLAVPVVHQDINQKMGVLERYQRMQRADAFKEPRIKGYFGRTDKDNNGTMVVSNQLSDTQRLSTLASQIGYAAFGKDVAEYPSQNKFEAGALAFMIHRDLGLADDRIKADVIDSYRSYMNDMKQEHDVNGTINDYSFEESLRKVGERFGNLKPQLDQYIDKHLVQERSSMRMRNPIFKSRDKGSRDIEH